MCKDLGVDLTLSQGLCLLACTKVCPSDAVIDFNDICFPSVEFAFSRLDN